MQVSKYSHLSTYEVSHLPYHLIQAECFNDATNLLADFEFLEHKAETGLMLQLTEDMARLVGSLSSSTPERSLFIAVQSEMTRLLAFLIRHPTTLMQCLWNSCWWKDAPLALPHYIEPSAKSQLRADTTIAIHSWLEQWRSFKESRGALWLRHYRPPPSGTSPSLLREFRGHGYVVLFVLVSPCGKYMVSGSPEPAGQKAVPGEIAQWDIETGQKINSLSVNAVDATYSPDGTVIAAALADGSIHFLRANALHITRTCRAGAHNPRVVRYSPNGESVIVGCYDGVVAKLSAKSGLMEDEVLAHGAPVFFIGFGRDGETAITASYDGSIGVWSGKTWGLARSFQMNRLKAAALSPDSRLLALSYEPADNFFWKKEETQIKLVNVATGIEEGILAGHETPVNSLNFSDDGGRLVSGSGTILDNPDNSVRVWDVERRKEIERFLGHSSMVEDVQFLANGSRVISASWDRTLRLWAVGLHVTPLVLPNHTGAVFGISFSPNGRWIVSSAWEDTRILLWDADTGLLVRALEGHESLVRSFRFSEDSRYLVSGSGSKYRGVDCTVRLWHVDTGRQLMVLIGNPVDGEFHGHVNPVRFVGFSNDGRYIISGHADLMSFTQAVDVIRVWDRNSGELVRSFQGDEQQAYELVQSGADDSLLAVLKEGALTTEDGERGHVLCGKWDNIRSIAAWTTPQPAGLDGRNDEIAVRTFQGEVGWLPDQLGLSMAASRCSPRWAIARGNHLSIFGMEGLSPALKT